LILIKKVCDQQGHFAMIFRSERYHELTLSAFYLEKEYIDKARRVFHVFTGVSRPANVTKDDTKVSRNCSTCHKAHINSILFCSSFSLSLSFFQSVRSRRYFRADTTICIRFA
jgi:hypothetical protein